MTQAHVRFPENVVRPPDDYSDLEESYILCSTAHSRCPAARVSCKFPHVPLTLAETLTLEVEKKKQEIVKMQKEKEAALASFTESLNHCIKTKDHSLTLLRQQHEEEMKKTEDQANSITQLREQYEEEMKKNEDQAHSLTQLRKQNEEEKKKTKDQKDTLIELRQLWNHCIKTKDHSLTQLREQYEEEKKKTEDLAHSLTQLRMQYESKDHSLTELQELYEEEKKNIKIKIKMTKDQTQAHSLNEVCKICEEVMKKEKEEVREFYED